MSGFSQFSAESTQLKGYVWNLGCEWGFVEGKGVGKSVEIYVIFLSLFSLCIFFLFFSLTFMIQTQLKVFLKFFFVHDNDGKGIKDN